MIEFRRNGLQIRLGLVYLPVFGPALPLGPVRVGGEGLRFFDSAGELRPLLPDAYVLKNTSRVPIALRATSSP